jgi:hypothetical protein
MGGGFSGRAAQPAIYPLTILTSGIFRAGNFAQKLTFANVGLRQRAVAFSARHQNAFAYAAYPLSVANALTTLSVDLAD